MFTCSFSLLLDASASAIPLARRPAIPSYLPHVYCAFCRRGNALLVMQSSYFFRTYLVVEIDLGVHSREMHPRERGGERAGHIPEKPLPSSAFVSGPERDRGRRLQHLVRLGGV